jgi:hypothetical protein
VDCDKTDKRRQVVKRRRERLELEKGKNRTATTEE